MNYNGRENEETYQASLYLQNDYELYKKALEFKERSIDSEVLSYYLRDLIRLRIREDKKMSEYIGNVDKVDFKEIARAFYDN